MKGLFLVFHGFSPSSGISKKIQAQVKALNTCGMETLLCYYHVDHEGNRVWKCGQEVIVNLGKGLTAKLKKRFYYRPLLRYISDNQIDLVYIRSDHNANPFTIHFINDLKQRGIRVVMEIPTYPYDQEYITWKRKLHLATDRLFRRQLAAKLNAIVTFSNEKEIFGQRTIRISNGIDFESIPLRQAKAGVENEIHLIGVAEIHYWHGFDRIINGMAAYYKHFDGAQKTIYFHLVGPFSGKQEEKEILTPIATHHLEKYVLLYGPLYGEELNELFNMAAIGIGSLGRHRSNITYIKTLKNREYAARGIPFVYAETDDDFESMPYILKVPADDSPIDINSLIRFYENRKWTPEEIRKSVAPLSWVQQMSLVLENS